MLSAERPYPLHGGGAYRTASLLHYFAQFADIDLILLAEDAHEAPVPAGILRSQHVITLPKHIKTIGERYKRNIARAIRGVPPLIDRLAGQEAEIKRLLAGKHYDLAIVEHFWCAPYLETLKPYCGETVLDLHNVESVLHRSCAKIDTPLIALGQLRFAAAAEKLEKQWLPGYSRVMVTSEADALRVQELAPGARTIVYPNALPCREKPQVPEKPLIVFAANFEYHPNIDAVRFLADEIWPLVREKHPELTLRLVGRGNKFVRHLITDTTGIEFSGPIPDTLPEVAAATAVVAPLRAGSGTRIKILEAWAAGRAVIATPLAAEGLEARDGSNILLGSAAGEVALQLCRAVEDRHLRERLGSAGRHLFEDRYSWPAAWRNLSVYNNFANRPTADGYTGII